MAWKQGNANKYIARLVTFNLYNHPCWCKWPCSGMILGKLGSACCPLSSNLMLLALRTPRAVRFKSGSMLVGATLSSVVEALSCGGISCDTSDWSWLWVCSWRGFGKFSCLSGTTGRDGTLDALCNVYIHTKNRKNCYS